MSVATQTYLKVKIRSLQEEAKIIKHEESRHKHYTSVEILDSRTNTAKNIAKRRPIHPDSVGLVNGLATHRKQVVRSEQRCTLIAYGFLRGRTFAQIESSATSEPNWSRVEKMITRYAFSKREEFAQFVKDAKAHVEVNKKAPVSV